MFELIKVGPSTYYIENPAKIGVYKADENSVYLIDSGNHKDAGRKILKLMEEHGWRVLGIVNTHSNADHIGGNSFIQQRTGCRIFSPGVEQAFTTSPMLEPSFLYGGYPFSELRHKMLLATPSRCVDVTDADFPQELEVIPLPGHFFDMVGFRTPDDVVFLADCLSSEETLLKYQLSFIYDVESYLKTLEYVSGLKARLFIPSHAEAVSDIAPLAMKNTEKVLEIGDRITRLCESPIIWEDLLKNVFDSYALAMTHEQYVLVGSTVRSYLSWLKDKGRLDIVISNNRLMWVKQ